MIRFILSLLIVVLLTTYMIIPLIDFIRSMAKSEMNRIDEVFNSKNKKKKNGGNK